jgi:hypothetical protein
MGSKQHCNNVRKMLNANGALIIQTLYGKNI